MAALPSRIPSLSNVVCDEGKSVEVTFGMQLAPKMVRLLMSEAPVRTSSSSHGSSSSQGQPVPDQPHQGGTSATNDCGPPGGPTVGIARERPLRPHYRGTSLIRNSFPPQDHDRNLGIVLL